MANRGNRPEANLNERIAVIRENNARIENRHREIELDKKRAAESGSSILPSQIKITICRNEFKPVRNGAFDNGNFRGKGRQVYRPRGGYGPLGYNLSNSLSHLPHDANSTNSQPRQLQQQFQSTRGRGGCSGGGSRNGFFARGGGGSFNKNNYFPPTDYVRHVEIERLSSRGKPQRYCQTYTNGNIHGARNGQHQLITPAKSMPSLDPVHFNHNSRPFSNASGNQGRGGSRGNFRPQNLPPRFRKNSYKGGLPGASSKLRPPPPPPFPPPSPSQPTPYLSQKWPSNKDRSAPWVRGNTIKSPNPVCRVAAVSTKGDEEVRKAVPTNDSPFINPDEDDDDGYIDDNPLDDLDQFTLKIDMDGGFVVHDATIHDPILSKPISSWIDDVASVLNDGEEKNHGNKANLPNHPNEDFKYPRKDYFDLDGYIFSNSSLTTSGFSTMSSLDVRLVGDDFQTQPIQKSYSADQLDKISKPQQNGNEQ